ncbi:MAG: hypothetical protein ABI977_01680 [Acidobacteriota bacterium]
MKLTKSYHELLLRSLQTSEEAAEYLNAALDDGDEQGFRLALQNVAEANQLPLAELSVNLSVLLNKLHLRFVIAAK